jgi:hypothetical protein
MIYIGMSSDKLGGKACRHQSLLLSKVLVRVVCYLPLNIMDLKTHCCLISLTGAYIGITPCGARTCADDVAVADLQVLLDIVAQYSEDEHYQLQLMYLNNESMRHLHECSVGALCLLNDTQFEIHLYILCMYGNQ